MKNVLFKDFGTFLNTDKAEQYEINKVVIFEDEKEKVIANYFLDNFSNNGYQFEINGEIKRKLNADLKSNINFVVKSDRQDIWHDRTQYTLYINGKLNNYIFIGLELIGDRLELKYGVNGVVCSQCIGWNNKLSSELKYHSFEESYKKINSYSIDSADMENNIKDLMKVYKKYKKVKEIEKAYTIEDYKKMRLESGTTKEENLTMLKNNGFDIKGL